MKSVNTRRALLCFYILSFSFLHFPSSTPSAGLSGRPVKLAGNSAHELDGVMRVSPDNSKSTGGSTPVARRLPRLESHLDARDKCVAARRFAMLVMPGERGDAP